MEEIWKDIDGFVGKYQVSNYGNVRRVGKRILKPQKRNHGYLSVWLYDGHNNPIQASVHRLVAIAFLDNPNGLSEVNHLDENKQNNRVDNLEWTSHIDNVRHGTGTRRMGRAHWTPVCQYTLDGKFIKRWKCMQDAADQLGLHMTHISAVCRGRAKTHGGFIWKYPEE